jgi:hypothetical protein
MFIFVLFYDYTVIIGTKFTEECCRGELEFVFCYIIFMLSINHVTFTFQFSKNQFNCFLIHYGITGAELWPITPTIPLFTYSTISAPFLSLVSFNYIHFVPLWHYRCRIIAYNTNDSSV